MKAVTNITSKKNSSFLETELTRLPKSLQSVLSYLNEALLMLDSDLNVVYINDRAKKIGKLAYGFSCNIGNYIIDLFPLHRKAPLLTHLQAVLKGEPVSYQIEIPKERGAIWLDCSYKPIRNDEETTGICVILKDITLEKELEAAEIRRKAAERSNAENRQLFETFMENTPLTAWITDRSGVMHYLNPTFRKLYNIPLDNKPRSIYELFPKDFADEYLQNNSEAVEAGKMIEIMERTPMPDGSMAIYKVFKFPMRIREQEMIGGWAIEITEEVQLQEQLTNSVERYTYVNEATSDAIYDWDVVTNIIYRGKGYALLFGFHNPYVPLDARFSRIHPADLPAVKKLYLESLNDTSVKKWNIEFRYKDAGGVYRTVLDKAFIMREGDKPVRVIGALQDITATKLLQEKILLGEESKKRAIVRSIIETQEKERRQLSVELHDNVNQILSSCKLMLEVAKENKDNSQALTEKSYESLKLAIAEIRKISHDLNPSSVVDFGLKEAIDEMIENINLSGKLNINFKFDDEVKKNILQSEDKIAVYRIVQEQLNNILKHARAKNVLIDIRVSPSKVILIIEDDGIGFNPRKINKGIGLKNIYHRVEYYHGTMDVKTAKNKGCRMDISLNISQGK